MKVNKIFSVAYPILFILLVSMACSEKSQTSSADTPAETEEQEVTGPDRTPGSAHVEGSIAGASNQPLYLQNVRANQVVPIDTLMLDAEGRYEVQVDLDMTGFYRLALSEENSFFLILSKGEQVHADADAKDLFHSFSVSGSHESERLRKMNDILAKKDSISMVMQRAQATQNQALFESAMTVYEGIMYDADRDMKAFINEEPASFASMAALQNLNPDQDFSYFEKVITALNGKANGNDIYDMMSAQVNSMRKLATGQPAPEIALPQPNGEILKLSDLRGQYVLIDFWASWCGPCRRENPNVKRVYEKYHDKGFEILGVSLDKTQAAWVAAIEKDGLTWRHVSDLKHWQSVVVPEYQIQGIPLTFLLDKEGKIIGKNLRGPALERKLAEIFPN